MTGPDEYNAIVDNNFYTNLMARENLKSALWALETIKERNPRICEELASRLGVTEEETLYWKKIIDNMYFPYDEQKKIYPLDDGFLMRKRWDESKIPEEKGICFTKITTRFSSSVRECQSRRMQFWGCFCTAITLRRKN